MGWTAGYVLENENGDRYDLTAPAPVFMVDVEGLGAVGDPAFAPLGDGFFLLTDDERSRESITGDLIYQEGAYGNYQNLVNWLMAARTLFFCYAPLEEEYRRVVKLRYINKASRNSGGIMRAAISFDPLTPWYQASNAELEITTEEANVKEYAYDGSGSESDEANYGYVYGLDDPTADDPDELVYGGEAAAGMSAVIYPIGHEPAAFLLRYTGAIENPIIRLVGQNTGEVYGICDVAVTLTAEPTEKTASGAVVSITDAIAAPVTDLTVSVEPVQSGSGDPSQSNIRPISGWTGVEVTRTGKNLLPPRSTDETISGVTWHINEDGSVLVSGTASRNSIVDFGRGELTLEPGTYTTNREKDKVVCAIWENSSPAKLIDGAGGTFTLANKTPVFIRFYVPSGETVNTTIFPQLELGSTATAYEPYQSATYEITFPSAAGTVYGGTLDVTTGKLTVTWAQIASYNEEALPGEWISDRDVYASGTTPTTGAQVVYELANPVTYDFTPQEVATLLGTNNIWSNAGGTAVTYLATGEAGDSIELCTQRENSYIKKIASDGTESSLLNDVNLSFDPYFRAPVTEPAVISIESNAPITGAASLTVYNYYRSV